MAERTRIAEGATVPGASVGVREDTERVCVPACCHTWKRVGKIVHGSMCCRALFCRALLTGFCFAANKFAAREVQIQEAKRSKKRKRTE